MKYEHGPAGLGEHSGDDPEVMEMLVNATSSLLPNRKTGEE